MKSADLTAAPSAFAARIAPHSERRGALALAVSTENAPDSAHSASDAATAGQIASSQYVAPPAPSEVRSAGAPPESSFFRGLALALGGAATLASVLRLLIGA